MPYDNVKFMEAEEKCMMTIELALDWTLKDNRLSVEVFSYNKTLRVIELNEDVTRKFVAWLLKKYKWPDDTNAEEIKNQIKKQVENLNQILADLDDPSKV